MSGRDLAVAADIECSVTNGASRRLCVAFFPEMLSEGGERSRAGDVGGGV